MLFFELFPFFFMVAAGVVAVALMVMNQSRDE